MKYVLRSKGGQRNSLLASMKEARKLLNESELRKYRIYSFAQTAINILDLLGVGLIGVIGALSIRGIQSRPTQSNFLDRFLPSEIQNLTFQKLMLVLSISAVSVLILKTYLSIILGRYQLIFLSKTSANVSKILFSKILRQNKSQISSKSSFELDHSAGLGVESIVVGVLGRGSAIYSDIFLIGLIFTITLFIDPFSTLSASLVLGLLGYANHKYLGEKSLNSGKSYSEFTVKGSRLLHEILQCYKEIYVHGRESTYVRKYARLKEENSLALAEQVMITNMGKYLSEITFLLGLVGVGALQFMINDAPSATRNLAIFAASASRVAPALLRIQQNLLQLKSSFGSGQATLELFRFLNKEPLHQLSEAKIDCSHPGFVPNVEISNLIFEFKDRDSFKLQVPNLKILPGEFVGIVGSSGSGKTTMVDLMLGIQHPDSGQIKISGLTPREAVNKWPGSISYVPQHVGIFDGSIEENILLGFENQEISEDLLASSIKDSLLEDLIATFPLGLKTEVGESGVKLSGGQKQRIGIARALVTQPRLIILDEATSALDGRTESQISTAIGDLKGEVTLIVITHRISSIMNADRIIYLEGGNVVGIGKFDGLLKTHPGFQALAKSTGY